MKRYEPYKLMTETNEYFIISYFDELEEKTVEKTLYRDEDCYYMITTQYKFREYFCKEITNKNK